MSWFKKAFKAVGKAGSFVGNKVLKPVATFVKPLAQAALSAVPVVGPVASALVGKLLPDAPAEVQEQAALAVAEVAAAPAPSTPAQAVQQASAAKQQLIAAGVPADQASTVGAVVHGMAQLPPAQAVEALRETNATLPNSPLQQGLTKADVKVVVDGAIKGAKDGAVDAYLDKTAAGQETKKEAIDGAGQKALPFILAGALLFIIFQKNK